MAEIAQSAVDRDRLVAWALGTFHAGTLLVTATLVLHLTGGLASVLTSLSTLTGLALFAALWLTTVWSTHRTLQGALGAALQPAIPTGLLIARATWRGGVNGIAFLPLLGLILAIPVLLNGLAAVPFLLLSSLVFATVGLVVAFLVGCVLGLLFAAIDVLLLWMARALLHNAPGARPVD